MTPLPAATLERRLGLAEAVGISVAIISPSIGMAFNITLVAAVAGAATPLCFVLGTCVMTIVALSFVAFSRRQAHAGAAYAFVAHAFGARIGTVAGWSMLLAYGCYAMGLGMLVGIFLTAAVANFGLHADWAMLPVALAAIAGSAVLAWRDVKLAGRLMLAMETLSIGGIVLLAAKILANLPLHAWSPAPFLAQTAPHGWRSMGFAMVFSLLSFAGFEASATLGEEARAPERTIPRAMLGSVIGTGLMYAVVSYAIVMGYGIGNSASLAHAAAPLDELARRQFGPGFAAVLDVCCAISAFSGALGSISGGVRILYALSRGGLWPALSVIDRIHHTPARAIVVFTLACAAPLIAVALGADAGAFYGNTGQMGTLAVIAVYACVTLGETVEARRQHKAVWMVLGLTGTAILAWAMLCSLNPEDNSPIWPGLVIGWLCLGGLALYFRPSLRHWQG
jgi:amino acid transporter